MEKLIIVTVCHIRKKLSNLIRRCVSQVNLVALNQVTILVLLIWFIYSTEFVWVPKMRIIFSSPLLIVRRTLKNGLTPEEALALGLSDSPEPQMWSSFTCPHSCRCQCDICQPAPHFRVVLHQPHVALGFCQLIFQNKQWIQRNVSHKEGILRVKGNAAFFII